MINIKKQPNGLYRLHLSDTEWRDLTRDEFDELLEAAITMRWDEPSRVIVAVDPRQAHTAMNEASNENE